MKKLVVESLPKVPKWRSIINKIDGAYSESTIRAYLSDVQHYANWCHKNKKCPFPATPKTLARFITDEAKDYATGTIKRRLAAIGKMHRLLKLKNPIQEEEVKIALRRALRGKYARPKQALGLTANIRDRLISICQNDSLYDKRDRALIAVGYDTLSRRSELSSILIEDITFTEKGAKIIITRAKNDQYGHGRITHISNKTTKLLKEWISASKIKTGPVFRSIKHDIVQNKAIHPYSINRIIKRTAQKAGMPCNEIQRLSGHSMRIGAAQDMMISGLDILPIMAAGGWKTTNVVARYIENANLSPILNKFFE